MKINGFIKDVTGANRIVKERKENIEKSSAKPVVYDHINAIARALHPEILLLRVAGIEQTTKTTRSIRLVAADDQIIEGTHIPVFQAGQYISFQLKIGKSIVTRPYSISSAPCEARGKNGYITVTIRKSKGDGFVSDYIYNEWRVGDIIPCTMPHGQFFYEPLRDSKNVVALAGGSGITPFHSMAKEIADGKLDFNLTIIYGSADKSDIIFKEDFDAIAKRCPKVKIVNVLSSNDPEWKGERGFINSEIIKKYSVDNDVTYFICGPQVMYRFVEKELSKLNIKRRRIRREVFGSVRDISREEGYPKELVGKKFRIDVYEGIAKRTIEGLSNESILVSLERAGVKVNSKCRSGECGFCRSQLLKGDVYVSKEGDGRRAADKEWGFIHPCSTYPISDIAIKIPISREYKLEKR